VTEHFGGAHQNSHVLLQNFVRKRRSAPIFRDGRKNFRNLRRSDDIKSKLLIHVLTAQTKAHVNRMSVECVGEYIELKSFLLAEYKLTPREYKVRFDTTTKSTDETHVLFAARLRNLLSYYLASKGVGGDFDKLCDLIIADRLKGSHPHGPLNYLLSLEGDDWFALDRVAFLSHRSNTSSAKAGVGGLTRVAAATAADGVSGQRKGGFSQQKKSHMPASPPRRCFVCNRPRHFAKDCCQRVRVPAAQRDGLRGAGSYSHQFGFRGKRGGAHVKLCTTTEPVRTVRMQDCGVQCEEDVVSPKPHENLGITQ